MTTGVRWDSTCSLRFIYKDSLNLRKKYQSKYDILKSQLPSDKRIHDELKYYKNIIDLHSKRIHESRLELILRHDKMFMNIDATHLST
jgi:hypothetical protein